MSHVSSLVSRFSKRGVIVCVVLATVIGAFSLWESNRYETHNYQKQHYSTTPYTHHVHPTRAEQAATLAVTNQFRRNVVTASQRFASASSSLVAAIHAGDMVSARRFELHSQAAFDELRASFAIGVTALTPLDALVSDQAPGTIPSGLHAVERDLWTGHLTDAFTSAQALAQAAPLLEFGVFRTILTPSAICGRLIELLSWTTENVITSSQERFSQRDMLDVRASVLFSSRVINSLVDLGHLIRPDLARQLSSRNRSVVALVGRFSDTTPNSDVSNASWRAISQQIASVQASLGELDGALNGLGTGRPYA